MSSDIFQKLQIKLAAEGKSCPIRQLSTVALPHARRTTSYRDFQRWRTSRVVFPESIDLTFRPAYRSYSWRGCSLPARTSHAPRQHFQQR